VFNGVRQGNVLSPVIFNVFINIFVTQLRQINIGCHLRSMFIGCLMYADDMILICPSVRGLQHMLDACISISDSISLQFNASKSHCLAVGRLSRLVIEPITLGSAQIAGTTSIKYLSITLMGGGVNLLHLIVVVLSSPSLQHVIAFMLMPRISRRWCI